MWHPQNDGAMGVSRLFGCAEVLGRLSLVLDWELLMFGNVAHSFASLVWVAGFGRPAD